VHQHAALSDDVAQWQHLQHVATRMGQLQYQAL